MFWAGIPPQNSTVAPVAPTFCIHCPAVLPNPPIVHWIQRVFYCVTVADGRCGGLARNNHLISLFVSHRPRTNNSPTPHSLATYHSVAGCYSVVGLASGSLSLVSQSKEMFTVESVRHEARLGHVSVQWMWYRRCTAECSHVWICWGERGATNSPFRRLLSVAMITHWTVCRWVK